jgi:hypothetical protein
MAFDPTAVEWLLGADRAQTFLGWHMARQAGATFPLGGIPDYVHPLGASLAYTDTYPWFSVLLLPFSPYLGDVFQHAGLWLGLSYGLLAAFSFRLLRLLTGDDAGSAVAAAIVVANPVLLFRQFHLALCAHWLIVAALLVYVLRASGRDRRAARGSAALLVVTACGTQPYLAVMVLGLLAAAAWVGRRSAMSAALEVVSLAVVAALTLYAFGYFSGARTVAAGFGEFSANLLALVDPNLWSRLIPDVPSRVTEIEGFAYLGLGPLLLALFVAVSAATRRLRREPPPAGPASSLRWGPLAAVLAAFAVFAVGSHARVGRWEIVDLSPWYAALEPIPSTLRASGRFVWPAYYAILFAILATLRRTVSATRTYAALCLVALAAQAIDAWPAYTAQGAEQIARFKRAPALADPAWLLAGADYDEIRLLPPVLANVRCHDGPPSQLDYAPFALFAGRHGLRINSGRLTRYPADAEEVCREQVRAVASGRLQARVVYVLDPALYDALPAFRSPAASCGVLDGYRVCVAAAPVTSFGERLLQAPIAQPIAASRSRVQ